MELLVVEEKLLLMFTYPRIFNSTAIKPVTIKEENVIDLASKEKFLDADLILANKAKVNNSYFGDLKSRIAFRVEHLDIFPSLPGSGCLKLSSNELFLLLTFKTKILECRNTDFYPTVNFRQIVEAAPALEDIDIYETNIVEDNTWVDLLNLLRNLKTVSLAIPDFNIDVANLAAVIEENKNGLKIYLYLSVHRQKQSFKQKHSFQFVTDHLSSHFVPTHVWGTCITVLFKFKDGILSSFYDQHYELKNK